MMKDLDDTLARERLVNNLIDEVELLKNKVATLERQLSADGGAGRVIVMEENTRARWELVVEDIDGTRAVLKIKEL